MKAKLVELLQSRKFWALVASVATTTGMLVSHQVTGAQALAAYVAALSAYKIGVGLSLPSSLGAS